MLHHQADWKNLRDERTILKMKNIYVKNWYVNIASANITGPILSGPSPGGWKFVFSITYACEGIHFWRACGCLQGRRYCRKIMPLWVMMLCLCRIFNRCLAALSNIMIAPHARLRPRWAFPSPSILCFSSDLRPLWLQQDEWVRENKLDNNLCSRVFWLYQEKQAYQPMKTTFKPLWKDDNPSPRSTNW